MQNPNVRDAAAAISTRIPPVPDLNIHPLDLNTLPRTEEELEEEEDRDHMATHESEIQNPHPHVGEPDICVICQDEYAEELVGGLRCGHEYHMKCIKKWLRRITKCPICRDTTIFVEPVFFNKQACMP
ncbi:probable E3 ubiquitin-protein ligase RHG1A [Daucus carota subsp. sativus]|uniref:probable E3 ubiquitin-protein ligase RHG1A n=1 Tax=Daucus carota subsp. sativus TaxID=79200 RepID=UPI003082FAAC